MDASTFLAPEARDEALRGLAASATHNIPGVDFVSITVHAADDTYRTVATTDPLGDRLDALQYDLREGPCYAALTDDRFVLANDLASSSEFPRYAVRAAELGVGSQAAVQLLHNGERAGLNLYARRRCAFDRSTVQPSCSPRRPLACSSTPCRWSSSARRCPPAPTSARRSGS